MACVLSAIGGIACETNSPGLVNFWYALQEEIAAIPDATAGVVAADITMEASANFKKLVFSDESGIMRVGSQGEIDGKSFFQEVEIFTPKLRAQIFEALKNVLNAKVVLIVEDDNGKFWVVGSLTKPARLQSSDGETGAGGTDRNGATPIFRVNSISHPPLEYTGVIPAA